MLLIMCLLQSCDYDYYYDIDINGQVVAGEDSSVVNKTDTNKTNQSSDKYGTISFGVEDVTKG